MTLLSVYCTVCSLSNSEESFIFNEKTVEYYTYTNITSRTRSLREYINGSQLKVVSIRTAVQNKDKWCTSVKG
jgi:hypothetical protein